jgi:hypothetical protein
MTGDFLTRPIMCVGDNDSPTTSSPTLVLGWYREVSYIPRAKVIGNGFTRLHKFFSNMRLIRKEGYTLLLASKISQAPRARLKDEHENIPSAVPSPQLMSEISAYGKTRLCLFSDRQPTTKPVKPLWWFLLFLQESMSCPHKVTSLAGPVKYG